MQFSINDPSFYMKIVVSNLASILHHSKQNSFNDFCMQSQLKDMTKLYQLV